MNFADELAAFNIWLITQPGVTQSQILLWLNLMAIACQAGWPETFNLATATLEERSGLDRETILRARNGLQQRGRIQFKRRDTFSAAYRIVPFAAH